MLGGRRDGLSRGGLVRGPEDVGERLAQEIGRRLVLVGIALDDEGRILSYCCRPTRPCSPGGSLYFGGLMAVDAAGVIIAHAHDGCSTAPRGQDLALTRRLIREGEARGAELVDHIIVAGRSWRSLRESTRLWDGRLL